MRFYRAVILCFVFSFYQVMGADADDEMPYTPEDMRSASYVMDHNPGVTQETLARFINAQYKLERLQSLHSSKKKPARFHPDSTDKETKKVIRVMIEKYKTIESYTSVKKELEEKFCGNIGLLEDLLPECDINSPVSEMKSAIVAMQEMIKEAEARPSSKQNDEEEEELPDYVTIGGDDDEDAMSNDALYLNFAQSALITPLDFISRVNNSLTSDTITLEQAKGVLGVLLEEMRYRKTGRPVIECKDRLILIADLMKKKSDGEFRSDFSESIEDFALNAL